MRDQDQHKNSNLIVIGQKKIVFANIYTLEVPKKAKLITVKELYVIKFQVLKLISTGGKISVQNP